MAPQPEKGAAGDNGSLLSPVAYDDDAASLHSSRSEQDTDTDDDELQLRARNSRELRAADRIVLMEEEERDELVARARRRGEGGPRLNPSSGLAATIGRSLFGGGGRSSSRSPDRSGGNETKNSGGGGTTTATTTTESRSTDEKRRARRERRREKKGKLKEQAEHGEDGALMYEMEEGGMKDGSSTGESSGREDSDELDRQHLHALAAAKAERARTWRNRLLLYVTIAVGFIVLLLVAWKLSLKRPQRYVPAQLVSNGSSLFGPTTVIISLDGFRADFLERGLTPRLNAFIKEGVSPKWMHPSFPSVTFPNHFTIATGLYPESHGVVGNTFWDPALQAEFYYTDPERSLDAKWWDGEPFWVTAERAGIRSAVHMWPGSEAHVMGVDPTYLDKYNGKESLPKKVSRLFEFLDRPGFEDKTVAEEERRPQLIAMYVPDVDGDGHHYGPNSTEIQATIRATDDMLDAMFAGLEERNLTHIVNVVVVSDHGMATTDVSRLVQLEDLVDTSLIAHKDGWPLVGLRPKDPVQLEVMHAQAVENTKDNPNIDVYLRDVDMPERYHFANNDRIAPLWIVPKTGWGVVGRDEFDIKEAQEKGTVYHPRGLHGYDHEHPLMRAIFVARGPAFPHPPNSQVDVFQNIEVYNILCDSVGMTPQPNNGTLRLPLKPVGTHNQDAGPPVPDDPETTSPATAAMTKSIGVDPVVTASLDSSTSPPSPFTITGGAADDVDDGDTTEEEDDEDIAKQEKGIVGFWDWVKGKVGNLWHKISGSEEKDSDSKSS